MLVIGAGAIGRTHIDRIQRTPDLVLAGIAGMFLIVRPGSVVFQGAALFDSVTNALKLFGDQHLARVQRAAIRRFRLDDWERSIARKLAIGAQLCDGL